jgi:hypothetical protein
MSRPKVEPHERRSVNISTAISERLKYQIELAVRIQGQKMTQAAFVESAILAALRKVKMPRPTGIPVDTQKGLWQNVRWIGGEKQFANADVRNRLSEFVMEDAPVTSVADEIILWDEDPAIRFFLRAYLASELLTTAERVAWDAIQAKTAIESVVLIYGKEYKSQAWEQSRYESYFLRNWDAIKQVIDGNLAPSALPDEKEVRHENPNVEQTKQAMKGKRK